MVKLKIYSPGLNRLCPAHFLTLHDPCLGRDPYFGDHCLTALLASTSLHFTFISGWSVLTFKRFLQALDWLAKVCAGLGSRASLMASTEARKWWTRLERKEFTGNVIASEIASNWLRPPSNLHHSLAADDRSNCLSSIRVWKLHCLATVFIILKKL